MDEVFRGAYNAAFGESFFAAMRADLEAAVGGEIPFRVAETPVFLPAPLRDKMARAAQEIVSELSVPSFLEKMRPAIPERYRGAEAEATPEMVAVDFAVCRDAGGELDARVIELQGFPSLYGLMFLWCELLERRFQSIPQLAGRWTNCFGGLDRARYVDLLARTVLAGVPAENVVLVDIKPRSQKTWPDFAATEKLIGVRTVCVTEIERAGRELYYRRDGKLVPIRRIYNRMVCEELERVKPPMAFDFRDDLEVSFCTHPSWYFRWSKYSLPFLHHPAVPPARLLSDVAELPPDLEHYVLKPLFSFAGMGVNVTPTRADVDAVPAAERPGWMLQQKVDYAPALRDVEGHGIKVEVRLMFLRPPEATAPILALNLARLSRGKMIGVDHNKDLPWTGGTLAMWPSENG
ncbi:MAG: hypothetical protein HY908_12960 [Myxococcales bacterium]|nr:hypothetical protein [Myxococcales bacterium]